MFGKTTKISFTLDEDVISQIMSLGNYKLEQVVELLNNRDEQMINLYE